MKTTRNTSSGIFRRRWQTGKRKFIAPSVIVLFMMILISVFTGEKSYSQGVGISDVSITPHASSILELRSTVLGFLAPRMNEGQRDGIGSPATGLIVYNTTTNKLNIYDGTTWRVLFSGNLGVNSVTGTLNRITISGTSADPIIDIASNYAGQASISILGTVTTGTWNASVINVPYGGTGLSSGISGGIPYFSTTTTMASSALLTANGVVIGGGTGGAPSTIGVGPANTVLRGTGVAPIFGQVLTDDISDNAITNIKMADNSVNTLELVNSSVTTAKIADANVTPIKIEPGLNDQVLVTDGTGTVVWINKNAFGAIADQISIEGLGTFLSPFKVKDLGIVTSMLADGAVTTIKIADGAVTNPKLALNSVLTGNIVDETILSEDIKDLEVKTSDLANLGVTTAKIADDAVTNIKMADNSVNTLELVNSSVTTAKIADDAVTNIKMADNSVNTLELVNSSVTTAKIADANVTPIKIEPGLNDQVLVTDGTGTVVWINKNAFGAIADQISIEGLGTFLSPFKVKDLGIVTSMLADGAVTTIKIADGAVTNPKLALNSVLTGNIVDETILSEDIKDLEVKTSDLANLGVTTAKIADDAVTNIKMADNSVNTLELVNSSVTTAKIADANVTPIKIEPGLNDQVLVTDGTGTVVWINKNAFGAIADQISIEGLGTFLSPFKVKDLGIVTSMLADGAVTTIKIADGAVTNPKLALNSVLTGNIVDETILSEDIKDLEVKTSDLANLGVTTAKIADDAVTNIKMADNSVNTLELVNSSVTTAKIADDAITNIKMADNSVNTLELVNSSVTTAKIADANVTPIKIEPGLNDQVLVTDGTGTVVWINKNAFGAIADQISIEGLGTFLSPFKVKDLGIVTSMLADGAVTTIKIADGAVTNPKLALNSVLTGNIVDETILSEDIKDLEVKTSDLANLGVTTAKIADDAVTNIKMADNSVNTLELVNSSVTTAKIADDAITNIKMADNSVNTLELVNGSVTTAKIADANVTVAKLVTAGAGDASKIYSTDGLGVPILIPISNFATSVLLNGQIFIGDALNTAVGRIMSGDATISNSGLLSLSNTSVTAGSYGSAFEVGTFTVDSKGRLTTAANATISIPASAINNATIAAGSTITGTNTGDQTSIVGITGTLAQFNTALTDADFATGGGTATGANTSDVTLGTANGLSLSTQQLSLALATGATSGAMSATDKTKLDAITGSNTGDQTITLTGDVTGSGTGSFATAIGADKVLSSMILDGTIVNADVSLTAAIAGTKINPDFGNQTVTIGTGAGATAGTIIMHDATAGNSFTTTIKANASVPASYTLTFPVDDGLVDQVLKTDGSGNLSWTSPTLGTVTSVTGTAPIASTGGSTPVISISAATTGAAGSMSASDKTKLDAITGINTGDQTITLTGDVTGSGTGSFATAIGADKVLSSMILDGTIVNADVSLTAGIAGTKINPDFGSQNVVTTGTITGSNLTGTNSGDQTSIVGITGTLAQFNISLTDADFATGGGTATGANTSDVTLGTANGLSLSTQQLSLALATGATSGAMSATDKTKLDAITGSNTGDQTITLTGDVTGSGTGSFATAIGADKVLSSMILDGTIVNADVSLTAAIAGTKINPDFGNQTVTIGTGAGATAGTIIMHDATAGNSFTTTIKANASVPASYTLTLPVDDGLVDQVLKTDGSGNLSWSSPTLGTVTSVTGTAPIASTGGSTPVISISAATGVAAGSMSAADKTKLDAITGTNTGDQTSIVGITGTLAQFNTALTGADFATGGGTATGANTSDVTLGTANGLSLSTQQLSLALATGATSGAMSATDKTKLDAITGTNTGDQTITLTGDVTGSGTGSFATAIGADKVLSSMILDGTIVNADVSLTAGIAGTKINPNFGDQTVTLGTGAGATAGTIIMHDATAGNSFTTTIRANASVPASYTLTLPVDDGSADQVLKTDGSGNLSWSSPTLGTVTSVMGTAPIASTGGSTPVISISAASGVAAGSMSAADKAKLDAISGSNTGDNAANTTSNTYADSKVADAINNGITTIAPSQNAVFDALTLKTDANPAITGATKTKITYDSKGLVTAGADATTADITDSFDKRYVSDAQLTIIGNTSGTNTGDNAVNTLYSGLVSNATHTGEVTGSGALTITNAAVTYAKIQNIAALSIIGRSANTAGVGAAISATAGSNSVLRESGNTVGFGSINLASPNAVGTSILPVANGGTGSATQNFVDLSSVQSVGGAKTWSALGTFSLGLDASGASVNLNAGSNFATNINTGGSTGTVTLGGTGTQTLDLGNGAGIKTVNLGSNTSTSTTTILSGTTAGVLSLNASAGGAVTNIGTGTTTGLVTIGGGSNQTISIGNGAAVKTVNLGSSNTSSVTNINAGTGGLNLTTGTATDVATTLGTTGSQVFASSTANSDRLAILPQSTTNTGSFTGTITSSNLTNARTYTFPDESGTIALVGGAASWLTLGNGGTDPATNFIGTTDNQDLVFRSNNIEVGRLETTGYLKMGDASSGTIRASKELVFREDGDVNGSSILRLRNRNGENGAIFETVPAAGENLVDFIFKTSGPIQRNIRFEARAVNARTGSPSFHLGGSNPDLPTLSLGDTYSAFAKPIFIGNMTSGSHPLGTPYNMPTALLHLAAGTSTAGTAPLKFTSGALLSTPEVGAIEFLTDKYYGTITTGAARRTFAFLESPQFTTPNIGAATGTSLSLSGSTSGLITISSQAVAGTYNFNLPTDAGTSGEVLVSGGGGGAPMTWENPSAGFTGHSRGLVANGTWYAPIIGNIGPVNALADPENRNLVWRSGTIKNLYVKLSGATGASTVTIFKNGVATTITISIPAGNTTGSDITNSFTVAPFDEIGVRIVTTGTDVVWQWAVGYTH